MLFLVFMLFTLTPEQRTLRARLAAQTRWAKHDPSTATQPARDAFLARFDREVDPTGELPEAERHRRSEAARKAYFTRLSLKSSIARSRKPGGEAA